MKKNTFPFVQLSTKNSQCNQKINNCFFTLVFLFVCLTTVESQTHTFATFSPGTVTSSTQGVSTTMDVSALTEDYLYFDVSAEFIGTGNVAWSESLQVELSNGGSIIHKILSNPTSGANANSNATTLHWTGVFERKYKGGNNLVVRFIDNYDDVDGPYSSSITNVDVTISQPFMANKFTGFSPGTLTSGTTGVSTALATNSLSGDYLFYNVSADFVGTGNVAWSNSIQMEINDGGTIVYSDLVNASSGSQDNPNAVTLHWNGVLNKNYIGGGNLTVRFFDNYNDASGPYTSNITNVNVTIAKEAIPHTFTTFSPGTITSNTQGVSTPVTTTGLTEDYLFYNISADFIGTGNVAWSNSLQMEINDGGTIIYSDLALASFGSQNNPDAITLHWTGTLDRIYTGGGNLNIKFFDAYHDASGPYTSNITNVNATISQRSDNSTLSIQKIDLGSITTYPNPTKKVIYLSNPQAVNLKQADLYDKSGKLIKSFDLSVLSTEKGLDISNLDTASYILIIKSNKGNTIRKIVKN
jgi:hypothetical protein